MSPPSSFDDVRTTHERQRRRYCPRCGTEGARPAVIRVMLNELIPRSKRQQSVATRSVSFCESCGVEMYQALLDVLMREGKQ